jgi:transcriptional antiterminator
MVFQDLKLKGKNVHRLYSVVLLLGDEEKPATVRQIAAQLGVSEKTVRNTLDELNECLPDDLLLVRKPGVGTWISGNLALREKMLVQLANEQQKSSCYSKQERRYIISRMFIISNRVLTAREISLELFINRTTIYDDISVLREFFGEYEIIIESDKTGNMQVTGDESKIRDAFYSLMQEQKAYKKTNCIDAPVERKLVSKLSRLLDFALDEKELFILTNIIRNTELNLGYMLTDDSFEMLVEYLAIALIRIRQNNYVSYSKRMLDDLRGKGEFSEALELGSAIQEELGIAMPLSEIYYITSRILCLSSPNREITEQFNTAHYADITEAVDSFINELQRCLSVSLIDDIELYHGICLLLKPALERQKHGMNLHNPLLSEIKLKYPREFGAVYMCAPVFERHLDIRLSEAELGYFALQLAAVLARRQCPLRVLVVCQNGVGTSSILHANLAEFKNDLQIMDMLSSRELEEYDCSEIDFILTTVSIEQSDLPVLRVKPLMDELDRGNLRKYIQGLRKTHVE